MAAIIFSVLVLVFFAAVFLALRRSAASASRRAGAPDGRGTARFRGGMWRPGKVNAGAGTARLEFFDWGIRLGSSGVASLAGLGLGRYLMPVWEARYEELTEARLVTAPKHRGIRLRAGVGSDEVIFWTNQGSDILDRLEQHLVPVDRIADQVPDPPPIRFSGTPGIGT